jgi:oligopeptide/dipeptide ABC transporter ATP-binding protein
MVSSDEARPVAGEVLLRVVGLQKHFPRKGARGVAGSRVMRAVDDVSFEVAAGECLAIVGESGSGKSTLARALLRLVEPTAGAVFYKDQDLVTMTRSQLRSARRHLQMIFQDPYASLHPRQTVAEIISEPWKVHKGLVAKRDYAATVQELLERVGLPGAYADLYPSRLSGGERQRVAIARALALRPNLLVLDEPVSALDVSIQAQVINVLMELHRELVLGYVFISHDLALVRLVADRVAVMYMGRFVEVAPASELYANPSHPYSQELLAASPALGDPRDTALDSFAVKRGTSAALPPGGCSFRNRCPKAQAKCETDDPALLVRGSASQLHLTACHFANDPPVPTPARQGEYLEASAPEKN